MSRHTIVCKILPGWGEFDPIKRTLDGVAIITAAVVPY